MHDSSSFSRRHFLAGVGGVGLAVGSMTAAPAAPAGKPFSFVHITDTHIQPELGAREGVHKAFAAIRALPKKERPAFALIGGDLIMDANAVGKERTDLIYDLWQEAAAELSLPLYYTVGNHDLYGISGEHRIAADDPAWGKRYWMKRLGLTNRYSTFDHEGWRFVLLDSVTADAGGDWWGEIDAEQLRWLDDLMRKTDPQMPIIVLTHMPLMTCFGQYTEGTTKPLDQHLVVKNGKEVSELLYGRQVKAVFQGHTHVVEECVYRGIRYITGGSICGDWWKGPRLGVHPEGFTVVHCDRSGMTCRYVPYGWHAVTA